MDCNGNGTKRAKALKEGERPVPLRRKAPPLNCEPLGEPLRGSGERDVPPPWSRIREFAVNSMSFSPAPPFFSFLFYRMTPFPMTPFPKLPIVRREQMKAQHLASMWEIALAPIAID